VHGPRTDLPDDLVLRTSPGCLDAWRLLSGHGSWAWVLLTVSLLPQEGGQTVLGNIYARPRRCAAVHGAGRGDGCALRGVKGAVVGCSLHGAGGTLQQGAALVLPMLGMAGMLASQACAGGALWPWCSPWPPSSSAGMYCTSRTAGRMPAPGDPRPQMLPAACNLMWRRSQCPTSCGLGGSRAAVDDTLTNWLVPNIYRHSAVGGMVYLLFATGAAVFGLLWPRVLLPMLSTHAVGALLHPTDGLF